MREADFVYNLGVPWRVAAFVACLSDEIRVRVVEYRTFHLDAE